jgi:hypothetical protein
MLFFACTKIEALKKYSLCFHKKFITIAKQSQKSESRGKHMFCPITRNVIAKTEGLKQSRQSKVESNKINSGVIAKPSG